MLAYGYEVEGSSEALADVVEVMGMKNCWINWNKFNTGDLYWDGNGNGYKVEINHEAKQVTLNEW